MNTVNSMKLCTRSKDNSTRLGDRRSPASSRESSTLLERPSCPKRADGLWRSPEGRRDMSEGSQSSTLLTPKGNSSFVVDQQKLSCFICHRCLKTFNHKSSITRHLDRKNECHKMYKCPYNDVEVNKRSLNKYYFDGVTKLPSLTDEEKVQLVLNYNENINIITSEFFTDYGKGIDSDYTTLLAPLRGAEGNRDMSLAGSTPIGDMNQSSSLLTRSTLLAPPSGEPNVASLDRTESIIESSLPLEDFVGPIQDIDWLISQTGEESELDMSLFLASLSNENIPISDGSSYDFAKGDDSLLFMSLFKDYMSKTHLSDDLRCSRVEDPSSASRQPSWPSRKHIKEEQNQPQKTVEVTETTFLAKSQADQRGAEGSRKMSTTGGSPSSCLSQVASSTQDGNTLSKDSMSLPSTSCINTMDMKKFRIMIDGIEKFKCVRCITIFNNEKSLIKHMKNKKTCDARYHKKLLYETYSAIDTSDVERSLLQKTLPEHNGSTKMGSHTTVINGTYIQNQQNINNNNIVNNNQVNPSIQLELKDFISSNFDYIHIKNNAVFDDDFFKHKTFLTHILRNDVNKIIYFDKTHAYIHTKKKIIRIPKDKAGYILMNKLTSTMESFLRSNSLINPADYDYIIHFYNVEGRKYLNDTLFKEYDFKTKQHVFSPNEYLRTRDHYLLEMASAILQFRDRIKEIFASITPVDEQQDSKAAINIENFIPISHRNKSFGDE